MHRKSEICLVSFLFHEAFIPSFNNLQEILYALSDNTTQIISASPEIPYQNVIRSKNSHIIIHKTSDKVLIRILRYVILNLKITVKIWLTKKKYDSIVFHYGQGLLLPMLIGKLLKKKMYWLLPSSLHEMHKFNPDPFILWLYYYYKFSLEIVDYIILFSPNLITEWNLEKFRQKILVCPPHNIHVDTFTITKPYPVRPPVIGYIGRLSEEKGLQNFIKALPAILSARPDLLVYIIGEGPLKESTSEWVQSEGLRNHIKILGWVSHTDLPEYLNQIQLLVIPSFTEGIPIIMLESMACGTPVLATTVGSVRDFVHEGETGFLLKDNTPECIAESVFRALGSSKTDTISVNARQFIVKNLTLENSIEVWKRILSSPDLTRAQ